MTSTTRATLLRQLASELFPERYIEFTALEDSSTTELQALALRHADASENSLDPGWMYIDAGLGIGDNERSITAYDPRAAATYGTITPHRPFSVNLGSTSVGFLYTGGLSPSQLIAHINTALRRSRRQRLLPLTLVVDGNMEDIDDTAWTFTSATGNYGGGAVTGDNLPSDGSQSYVIVHQANNSYAESIALRVAPGEKLRAEATGRMTTATGAGVAQFIVYDKTNSAAIATVSTTSRVWVRMPVEFTVPAGCNSIAFRLAGTLTSTASAWDEVLFWRTETSRFPIINEIVRGDDVLDVFQRRNRSKDPEGNYHADDFDLIRLPGWEVRVDEKAVAPVTLELARSGWDRNSPLLVECLLPYPALSSDDATTGADRDDIILRAKAMAYAQLARIGPGDNRKFYKAEADLLARTWATHASRQPRPARPIKGPRSAGMGNSNRRWWRGR